MKIKIEFFKERHFFEFRKWYTPMGNTFYHYVYPNKLIYETNLLLSTPLGCIRITIIPYIL